MLTALVGAVVGGLLNVAAYVIARLVARRKIQWGILAGSFVGGAVGGALAGATFGLSFLGAGGMKTLGYLAATSAASTGAGDVATNVATGRAPLAGSLLSDMGTSAAEGVALYGGARLAVKLLPELKPLIGQPDAAQQASRIRRVAQRVKHARSAHAAFAIALNNATQGWLGSLASGVAGNLAPQLEHLGCVAATHTPAKRVGIVDRLCAGR